jgi:choline dehydrogenase-like flavoprotein
MAIKKKVDVVVAGSGPGGASVARHLAKAGKNVLMLEKGAWHKMLGNHLTGLLISDKCGISFSEEGLQVVRAVTLGGSTIMYCGAAMEPPQWFNTKYGIELDSYSDETIEELNLKPLPDDMLGSAGNRILEASNELGYKFEKLKKFIDPDKCKSRCGGTCMLGCPHGAKWTSREYVQDMLDAGGELMTKTDVSEVTHSDGVVTGVKAFGPKGAVDIEADVVIVSAGGIGTPSILQKSGIYNAGVGMFIDPLIFVTGISRFPGNTFSPPMTIGSYELMEENILLSDLIDPWGMWFLMTMIKNPSHLLDFLSYRRMLGIMVKIGDERKGFITIDGKISKPLGEVERFRLNKGAAISREILIKAGCAPESIIVGPVRGAHPGGTARIGEIVDTDLQTEIKNLYVSDASVIPQALDMPVVLTAISLGKRLGNHLMTKVFV